MPSTQVSRESAAHAGPSESGSWAHARGAMPCPNLTPGPSALELRPGNDPCGVPWFAPAVPARRGGLPAVVGENGENGENSAPGGGHPGGERGAEEQIDRETTPGPAVLFVDDEVGRDAALVRLLELEGFKVECAASGAEGLARALARPWDAILLDLHLPDMSGLEVLERLKSAGIGCPVIAVTGWYVSEEAETTARRLGAFAFRFKPLDAADVADVLRAATAAGQRLGAAGEAGPGMRPRDGPGATAPRLAGTAGEQDDRGPDAGDEAARLLALHERVRAGDRAALAAVMSAFLPVLVRWLRRRFPRVDDHLLAEAAEDALLDYARRPERFDPRDALAFQGALLQATRRNAVDRLRSESRRRAREGKYVRRALDEARLTELDAFEMHHDVEALLSRASEVDFTLSTSERQALRLLLEGERSTAAWARVLDLADRPPPEQRRVVKRIKDRLLKRLRRWWRGRS